MAFTVEHLDAWYGRKQALFDINLSVEPQDGHCDDRAFGVWQVYLRPLSQSHARGGARCSREGHGAG